MNTEHPTKQLPHHKDIDKVSKRRPFYKIHPLYERLRHLRGAIILVEGIIGAGKSTLSHKLYNLLKHAGIPVLFLEEEVDPVMLDLFLSDMKKYAFAFQMLMLVQRQKIYMQGLDFARKENGVVIIDVSVTDILYTKKLQLRY